MTLGILFAHLSTCSVVHNQPNSLFGFQKGSQKICLPNPGLHELHFVNSCIFFGNSSFEFDTLNQLVCLFLPILLIWMRNIHSGEFPPCFPHNNFYICDMFFQPVTLTGAKYLLRGEIHVTSMDHDVFKLSKDMLVDVLNKNHDTIDRIQANYLATASDEIDKYVFEYSVWANLGEELIFVPRHTR